MHVSELLLKTHTFLPANQTVSATRKETMRKDCEGNCKLFSLSARMAISKHIV